MNKKVKSISPSMHKFKPYVLFILAFLLYANTLNHDYVLDDALVITQNEFTRQGIKGLPGIFSHDSFRGFFREKKDLVQGGRYRPLSLAMFAIEYHIFGSNPFAGHLLNVLFYALTAVILWLVLKKLFVFKPVDERNFSFHFIAVLLFVFHPVHSEVVANIKGRDEIMALLLSLIAFLYALKYSDESKPGHLFLIFLFFFSALLAKESIVPFLVVIPVSLLLFRTDKAKHNAAVVISLFLAFFLYALLRYAVTGGLKTIPSGELMNNPFLYATPDEKWATIFYTLGMYVKLLFLPYPLTFDYYPYHIALQSWNVLTLTILILCIVMVLASVVSIAASVLKKKRAGVIAYSVFFFFAFIFIVSNIPFTIGTFMNERFLYTPSVAFCIAAAYGIHRLSEKSRRSGLISGSVIVPVLLIFGAITVQRNTVWKDDYTLFTHDVKISSNSAKSNCSAGGALYERAVLLSDTGTRNRLFDESLKYLRKAVSIHPGYGDAWRLLGNVYYEYRKNIPQAIDCYVKALKINPGDRTSWQNADLVLNGDLDIDEKITAYEQLLKIKPARFETNYNLGNLYGRYKNNITLALHYLHMAAKANPNHAGTCKDLGVAYGIKGDYSASLEWFLKAQNLDPRDPDGYINLGITYQRLGNTEKAREYFKKGEQMRQ